MIPKLTIFAVSRWLRDSSAWGIPKTCDAVAAWMSSPRANASRSTGSPETWARIRSSTWL